jgi:hypothetical protein
MENFGQKFFAVFEKIEMKQKSGRGGLKNSGYGFLPAPAFLSPSYLKDKNDNRIQPPYPHQ